MTRLLTLVSFLLLSIQPAQSEDDLAFRDTDGGWHEAVIMASNLERMKDFFEDVAGWETIAQGNLSRDTVAYFTADAKNATGRYAVIKPRDFRQGWVRIIELEGVPQKIIRSNAQAWDTGGIFSIMTRSANIERNLKDAEKHGWLAYNDPYDFGFGPLKLRNIVLRGPDGLNVAIYEWVEPKRQDSPPEGAISKAFNSMQMVADIEKVKEFYMAALGFDLIQEGAFLDEETTLTNFALPINFSTEIERDYAILIPEGADNAAGRIELMRFRGFEGRDLSSRSSLSNLGIATLMFPVSDLSALQKNLAEKSMAVPHGPQQLTLPPFGNAEALTIASPEGALLTFFELNAE